MVVIGGVLIGAAAISGWGWLTVAAAGLALVVGVAAILVRRPARPWAWWLLMLSSAMVVVARASAAGMLGIDRYPFGDLRAIIFYLALALGLVLIVGRPGSRALADTLDATIVALGAFLVMWLFLLGGRFRLGSVAPLTAFVRPIAAAVLAGAVTRMLFVVERRTPSFWLLVAAAGSAEAGAIVSLGREVGYPYVARMESTGAWFAGYAVLVTAAVLHSSSATRLPVRRWGVSRFNAVRGAVFAVLTLLGPLTWVVAVVPSPFNPGSVLDLGFPIIIAALISLLLLWRLALITQLADTRADQLQSLQGELAYRAAHDPLTGLGNRSELSSRLDALVEHRADGRSALLLLDLDDFKHINDSFGHPVGDELLIEVGRRLSSVSPPGSTVVRLGGDEFAIVLNDVDESTAVACAELVRDRVGEPLMTSRGELAVTASIGVCARPRVEWRASEVLRDADLALYSAKASGGNRVHAYDGGPRHPHQADGG